MSFDLVEDVPDWFFLDNVVDLEDVTLWVEEELLVTVPVEDKSGTGIVVLEFSYLFEFE